MFCILTALNLLLPWPVFVLHHLEFLMIYQCIHHMSLHNRSRSLTLLPKASHTVSLRDRGVVFPPIQSNREVPYNNEIVMKSLPDSLIGETESVGPIQHRVFQMPGSQNSVVHHTSLISSFPIISAVITHKNKRE